VDFDTYFKKVVYHVPFGGMTFRAHRASSGTTHHPQSRGARALRRKTAASLVYNGAWAHLRREHVHRLDGPVDTTDDLVAGGPHRAFRLRVRLLRAVLQRPPAPRGGAR
jgi:hypothetical protein